MAGDGARRDDLGPRMSKTFGVARRNDRRACSHLFKELVRDIRAAVVAGLDHVTIERSDAIAVAVDDPIHAFFVEVARE